MSSCSNCDAVAASNIPIIAWAASVMIFPVGLLAYLAWTRRAECDRCGEQFIAA